MTSLSPDKRLIDAFSRKLTALYPVRAHACLSSGFSARLWGRLEAGKTRRQILWLIRLDELFETNISWAALLSSPGKGSGEYGKYSRSLYR